MKVLFLDFDGVLNIWPAPSRSGIFHKPSCTNLEYLIGEVPELRIVISSAWRMLHTLEELKRILKSNSIDSSRVIGVTGNEQSPNSNEHRGFQIECWLKRHPNVKTFAIVDDETDMGALKSKLVKTDRFIGLTQENVEKLLEVLEE